MNKNMKALFGLVLCVLIAFVFYPYDSTKQQVSITKNSPSYRSSLENKSETQIETTSHALVKQTLSKVSINEKKTKIPIEVINTVQINFADFELDNQLLAEVDSYGDNFIPLDTLVATERFCVDGDLKFSLGALSVKLDENFEDRFYHCIYSHNDIDANYFKWQEVFE